LETRLRRLFAGRARRGAASAQLPGVGARTDPRELV